MPADGGPGAGRAAHVGARATPQGHGRAHGAITVLNATATGIGCSLGIEGGVAATWTWTDEPGVHLDARRAEATVPLEVDAALAEAVARRLAPGRGARATTRASLPPSRGLKTSSSAAAALVQAATAALGYAWKAPAVIEAAIAASRDAGVTITGALDDQVATVRGGCVVVDNVTGDLVRRIDVPAWTVAIWVPAAKVPKAAARAADLAPIRTMCEQLGEDLRLDNLADTLTENGRLFAACYRAAGLPIDERPAQAALAHGALGAGLSGTGPAIAALFPPATKPFALPPVPGGAWAWSQVRP